MAKKWFVSNLDKVLWAVIGTVLGGVLTPLILSWVQERSSEIVVRQYYNTIEPKKRVPKQIGGLILDYEQETREAQSVYLVVVANVGSGPEEDLRVQVKFPEGMQPRFQEEPDFRVYKPEEMVFAQGTFFMSLKQFPAEAAAPVSFAVGAEKNALCLVKIKVAGKEKEGHVESIKGIKCDSF